VTAALACQHQALLRRAMLFPALGAIETTASILGSALAVAMAFTGFGYWALVFRPITTSLICAAAVWWRCAWLPTRPVITGGVSAMVRFGFNSTGFTFTDFVARSVDRVAIGYRSGAAALGHYQNALFVYYNLLDVLVHASHGVAVASLSKLRAEPHELQRLWAKAMSTLAFYAMPGFGLLAVVGQDLIVVLVGEKWADAGTLLAILALRGMPHSIERTLGWLHVSAGRTDRWMKWGLLSVAVHCVAVLIGSPFGVKGIVLSYVVCTYILFVPAISYAGRPLGIGSRDVVNAVGRPMVASLAAVAGTFLLSQSLLATVVPLWRIAPVAATYLATYLVIAVGVFKLHAPLVVVFALLRDSLARRFAQQAG
jgi:PST family polysaccharide transporter